MSLQKYLFLLVALFAGIVARGQDFNPTNPAEPSATYLLTLKADPAEAGTVTGGGKYAAGKKVTLKATPASVAWRFVNWTDSSGEELSTSASYSYTTTAKNEILTAHFAAVQTSNITLSYTPMNGGLKPTLTGAGMYTVGKSVIIKANTYADWKFVNWTRKSDSQVMSESTSFTYVTTEDDVEFVANYRYSPGSNPAEPSETKPSHKVYFKANPSNAGYFDKTSGFSVREDVNYSVYAYSYSGYEFINWTINDVEVGTSRTYSAPMGTEDVHLVANYRFNPSGPNDPGADSKQHYTLYGQTVEMYKGQQTLFPVYLENTKTVKSLSFTMNLPEGVTVDTDNILTTSRTSAYTVDALLEGRILTISLTGGSQISDVNGAILQIPVNTTMEIEDGTYDMTFGTSAITLFDDSTPDVTSRKGQLIVTTLEEGEIQASFSVDRYMNRAQFTNLSTEDCKTFLWEFGDGETSTERNPMHIYAAPGTYTVRLTAKAIIKTSDAEQTLVVNPSSSWRASGDYTLNNAGTGVRNFTSMAEAMELLSQCTIDGDVVINVLDNDIYTYDAKSEESLNLVNTMKSKMSDHKLTFKSETAKTVAFITNDTSADLQTVMDFITILQTNNVTVTLNGVAVDATILQGMMDEVICAEANTTAVNLESVSAGMTVEWVALVGAGSTLSEYVVSGTGNIPSMQIKNSGAATQDVNYQITFKLGAVTAYTTSHKISVKPLLANQTLTCVSPANGSEVVAGSITLSWTNLNSLATDGYTVELARTDVEEEPQYIDVATNKYTFTCTPGAGYRWKVTAHGTCDDLESTLSSFTVKDIADLVVTEVIVPDGVKALTSFTISATIKNIGMGATAQSSWTDALYRSTNPDNIAAATRIATVNHSGALAPAGTYVVEFTTEAPDASVGQVYYFVMADYNNNEKEKSEINNSLVSDPVSIAESFMDEGDYAALKTLFNATNGEAWTNKWKVNSNAINSTAWPGVTFNDDGRVVAINVANNNLVGTLPAEGFVLPMLTSLNLSRNTLNGDLAEFVSGCTALTTLNMSYCRLTELTGALSSKITSLDLSYQNDSRALSFFDKQEWNMGSSVENVVLGSLLSYNHKAGDFSAHPHMYIYNVGGSYLGSMSYTDGAYRLSLSGDYKQPNNAEVYLMPTEGVARYTRLHASLSWLLGDSNVDAVVDVLDAQHTLNRILARQSGSFNFSAGNVYNTDDVINVQDVVATINLFIEDDVPVGAKVDDEVAPRYASEMGTELYTTADGLYLDAEQEVAALDITLQGVRASQVSLQLSHSKFQMFTSENEGGLRIVILSPSGYDIPVGKTRILKLSQSNTAIVAAKAADIDAQEVMVNVVSAPTGIEDVEMLQDMPQSEDVYDIQGRKVESPTARGIYIQNGRKVIIK